MRKATTLTKPDQDLLAQLDDLNIELLDLRDAWKAIPDKRRPPTMQLADARAVPRAGRTPTWRPPTLSSSQKWTRSASRPTSRRRSRPPTGRGSRRHRSDSASGSSAHPSLRRRRRGRPSGCQLAAGGYTRPRPGGGLERPPRPLGLGQAIGDDVQRALALKPSPTWLPSTSTFSWRSSTTSRQHLPAHDAVGTAVDRRRRHRQRPRGGARPRRRTSGRSATGAGRRGATPRCGRPGPSAAASRA